MQIEVYKRDAFWDDLEKSVQKKDDTLEHIFFLVNVELFDHDFVAFSTEKSMNMYVCVYFGALRLFFLLPTSI